MASFKDLLIRLPHLRTFSDAVMSTASCGGDGGSECRDDAAALRLKFCAMAAILLAGVIGVSIPLVGKKRRFVSTDSGVFLIFKAFAAGVILATGFVHMLPDGEKALTDPCLPKVPWEEFPFAGFVAMVAALLTLVLEFVGTQFYEVKKREEGRVAAVAEEECCAIEVLELVGCEVGSGSGVGSNVRHMVVSQILELGIVSHSVIIGLSLGVSHSPCTIRPLIGALSFHQFFEGFALGGCISQAKFVNLAATSMACFFAVTTPTGIAFGAALSSFYNGNSPRALVVEGIFDCISAGILIYMSLVDLIAADLLSSSTRHNVRTQAAAYFALFLGAVSMSLLAIWA